MYRERRGQRDTIIRERNTLVREKGRVTRLGLNTQHIWMKQSRHSRTWTVKQRWNVDGKERAGGMDGEKKNDC